MKKLIVLIACIVVVLDQITKYIVRDRVFLHEEITIIPGLLNITRVQNTGVAFGLFSDLPMSVRAPFFLCMSLMAVVILFVFMSRLNPIHRMSFPAMGGIIGGAIGNTIDRLVFGSVTDFIDFYVWISHWPSFNVADSAITVSVIILVFEVISNQPDSDVEDED